MDVSLATLGVHRDKALQQISSFTAYDEFISAGLEARQLRDNSSWVLGCLALGVEKKYGSDSLGTYSKEIGVSVSSLSVYRWVVAKFLETDPNYVPPESVSFGVLEAAARLPSPEERNQMVESAAENGMTVERARKEVTEKNGNTTPTKPKGKWIWCELHRQWAFISEKIEEVHAPHEGMF